MSELALGTVQFGLDYGIKNGRGKVTEEEVVRILEVASHLGVQYLDTAAGYGTSEAVLGQAMRSIGRSFQIVTKLSFSGNPRASLNASLERLGVDSVYGYLYHYYKHFKEEPGTWSEFRQVREEGKAQKIGFSLYHPFEAEELLESEVDFSLVQVPYSLLDRRFGYLFPRLVERGIEIHVRSVFLQGLLLMDPTSLPPGLTSAAPSLERLAEAAKTSGTSVQALCLAFPALDPHVSKVVIGVDSLEDFESNVVNFGDCARFKDIIDSLGDLLCQDERIILPYLWPKAV